MISAVNVRWTVTENVDISVIYSFLIFDKVSIWHVVSCICLACLYWKCKGLHVTCRAGRGAVEMYICSFLTLGLNGHGWTTPFCSQFTPRKQHR